MSTPRFRAVIKNGEVIPVNPEAYNLWLRTFRDGTIVNCTVRKASKIRSIPQNSYYWGVVLSYISAQTGYEPEEVHINMKYKFLRHGDTENYMNHIKSTTELNTEEFEEYLEYIRRWAAQFLELYIPLPNEIEL